MESVKNMKKEKKVETLVNMLLDKSHEAMKNAVTKAINSGALDIDSWDENSNPMIIPKIIATALLECESHKYSAKGTSFEKLIKKEVKNLKYFI